jgi:hypothetical protein
MTRGARPPTFDRVTDRREQAMNGRTQDRLFAGAGIGSVAVMLAGFGIAAAGGREFATISSTPGQITKALASPAGGAVWAGSYVELLSFGLFLAFAAWATAKLGGGLLGSIGRATATAYATLSIASLCLMGAIEYRAGHGMGLQLGTALITVNEALFVGTWFLAAFFLLAVAPLARASGRRVLGWSAVAIAAITLVTTAVSLDNLGQMANVLWLAWIVGASVSLARGEQRSAARVAVALEA